MASSPIFFAFFFLLSLFSIQILARDAQFFNKVSPTPTTTTTGIFPAQPTGIIPAPTTTVFKDDFMNNNQQQQEQDPSFVQESQNAYGLYGQESTQHFPTTTKLAGNTPYTTTGTPSTYKTPQETYTNYPNSESNNNYYNNEQFTNTYGEQQQQNSGENTFQESVFAGGVVYPNNKKNDYNSYNGGFGNKNVERQGMSDTRFMENGKYYHENNNNNNYYQNQYQNSRNNNGYDSRAYYNSNSNDENNNNAYEFNNSMENFQKNQGGFQENNEHYVP